MLDVNGTKGRTMATIRNYCMIRRQKIPVIHRIYFV